MSRCTVCQLAADRLNAIDTALRGGKMSLGEISSKTGLTRSCLHRHRQHLPAVQDLPVVRQTSLLSPAAVAETSEARPIGNFEMHPQTATKAELLDRLEYLWQESLDGLQATKEPIRVVKPDGSIVEIPGDLRSRPAFIREARSVLEMKATVNGDLTVGQAGASVMIVVPIPRSSEPGEYECIEIGLPPRKLP